MLEKILSQFVDIEVTKGFIEDVTYLQVKIFKIKLANFIIGKKMDGGLIIKRLD